MNPCCETMLEMPRFKQKYKDLCPTLNGGTVNPQLVNVAVFKATQMCWKVCAPVPATQRPNSIAEGGMCGPGPILLASSCGVHMVWDTHWHYLALTSA